MIHPDIQSGWTNAIENAFHHSEVLCIALLSHTGEKIYFNRAMQAIFDKGNDIHFVNPVLEYFINARDNDCCIFEGLITIGNESPFNTVIYARVYKKKGQIFISGEIDVKTLLEQNEAMTGLNFEITNLQRQLIKEKKTLVQTLDQLKETQAMLIHSEKMNALGNLVAGIAHEINNPLAFIYSNVSSLKSELSDLRSAYHEILGLLGDDNSVQRKIHDVYSRYDIEFILGDTEEIVISSQEGLTRIKKLVDDLRRFSRHDEAKLKTIELISDLNSTISLILPEIRNKNITCKLIAPEELMVDCYPSELNQAFLNILINSMQAINHNNGLIVIEVKDKGGNIEISVTDNGEGIAPHIKKDIFNPFFTTKPVGSGTGLGLSLAYKIVNSLHGGELSFTSEVNQGATFTILIPKLQKQK